VASRDIDPLYPVLRWVTRAWEPERRLWFLALYVAHYNVCSALAALDATSEARSGANVPPKLPIATERRGLRRPELMRVHLAGYWQLGPFMSWLWPSAQSGAWEATWNLLDRVPYNGRWACYKWMDLLREVAGAPLRAPDLALEGASGPRQGLMRLGVPLTVAGATLIREALAQEGVALHWDELETVLCNFHEYRRGRYYVGHDIDELQHAIERAPQLSDEWRDALWLARRETLPPAYLGELGGERSRASGRVIERRS